MERLNDSLNAARKALRTFAELVADPHPSVERRDATIKRFEYTVEALWKAAQRLLADKEGRPAGSPKAAVRMCRESGFLSEEDAEMALAMIDDRNLTAHTYNEPLAVQIAAKLASYAALAERWLTALERRAQS